MLVGSRATDPGRVPPDPGPPWRALMRETGQSTGNLAFWRRRALVQGGPTRLKVGKSVLYGVFQG
jgi:hypothetical protein